MAVSEDVCYLCQNPVKSEDAWCYGCKRFICEDHPGFIFGSHEPEDHDSIDQ